MGTTLTGTTPQDTYDSLIKVTDNGPLSGTAKYLSDGLGNDSALALSTTKVGINTSSPATNLHISGDANGRALLRLASTAANRLAAVSFYGNNVESAVIGYEGGSEIVSGGVQGDLIIRNVLSGKDIILDTNAGNVGIGTLTPANVLDLGPAPAGRALTWANSNSIFSSYSAGSLVLSSNFYGSTSTDTYLTSNTATFGAAGIRVGANDGAGNSGLIRFFADTAAAKTAGAAFTPTERVRIDPDGLKFNGDTAAANALDDYEEGTFTPTAYGATSAGTTTYNNQNGYYTKIGRMVNVSFFVSYSALTGTGSLLLGGLPFAISNSTQNYPIGSLVADGLNWTGGTYLQAIGLQGETNIAINYIADDASVANQQCVNEAASLRINLTYFV